MKKDRLFEVIILVLRWYLIVYMVKYGISKLTMNQFGVYDSSILKNSLENVDSFYVAWHLFQRSYFFNICTGMLEIIGGILLMINRTKIIGALIILSILTQIFIIDISFTTGVLGVSLPLRIAFMIFSDLAILYYYRKRINRAYKVLTINFSLKSKNKWWIYPLLIIVGVLMDFVFSIITYPIRVLLNKFL